MWISDGSILIIIVLIYAYLKPTEFNLELNNLWEDVKLFVYLIVFILTILGFGLIGMWAYSRIKTIGLWGIILLIPAIFFGLYSEWKLKKEKNKKKEIREEVVKN